MTTRVGTEGQIVLEPEVRRKLGIAAGWQARQIVAGDHLEIYFEAPQDKPVHNGVARASLRGAAKPFIRQTAANRDWDEAVSASIAQEF